MEFYGTLGKIQRGSNFLVGQALHNAAENFFFATRKLHGTADGLPCLQQFLCFLCKTFQLFTFRHNHHKVIARRLAPHHTVHGEQSSCLVYWKASIRPCLHVKMGDSGVLFIKIVKITRDFWAGTVQLMLFTSADKLHAHPSVQPRETTEAYSLD